MKVCTYDNPGTYTRECWKDGKLICAYSYLLFPPFARKPIPAKWLFFGANMGNWETGRLWGDREALPEGEL